MELRQKIDTLASEARNSTPQQRKVAKMRGKAGNATTPPPQAPMAAEAPKPSEVEKLAEEGRRLADEKTPEKPADKPNGPGAGHNSTPGSLLLVDDKVRAPYYALVTRMVMRLDDKLAELKRQMDAIKEEKSQIFKEGKARLGFNRADFEYGISLKRSKEDEDGGSAALETHRRHIQIAIWENHPIATQPELPLTGGSAPDRTPSVDRAFLVGLTVGREPPSEGQEPANRCSPPSEYGPAQAQAWMKGFHQGDGERVTMLNMLRPLQDGGLWPDDPQPDGGDNIGPVYDPEAEHPDPDATIEDGELAEAVADGLKQATSNVFPIGKTPSTAEVL